MIEGCDYRRFSDSFDRLLEEVKWRFLIVSDIDPSAECSETTDDTRASDEGDLRYFHSSMLRKTTQ
jgi:hypothetical protein